MNASERRRRIVALTLVDYYLPGFRAGGPMRSIENMADQMAEDVSFHIVTRNRDFPDDNAPYSDIEENRWYDVGAARVQYATPDHLRGRYLLRILRQTPCDVLYLNSGFSRLTLESLLFRRLGLVKGPVVVAPRGVFHVGAMRSGSWPSWFPAFLGRRIPPPGFFKKWLFSWLARVVGLFRGVVWHASNDEERRDIIRHVSASARVVVAPNLAARYQPGASPRPTKRPGHLRAVFVSRLDRKKNLLGAIRALSALNGSIDFDIYGPIDDPRYWQECQAAIRELPPGVTVRYGGAVSHSDVPAILRDHELFFFLTLGENFGHVISEALGNGCPALISDRTPWRGLEAAGAGWDVSLEHPAEIRRALQHAIDMTDAEYRQWSARAMSFAAERSANDALRRQNVQLFQDAVGNGARTG